MVVALSRALDTGLQFSVLAKPARAHLYPHPRPSSKPPPNLLSQRLLPTPERQRNLPAETEPESQTLWGHTWMPRVCFSLSQTLSISEGQPLRLLHPGFEPLMTAFVVV